jgi:hypothetical protein
VFKSSYTNHYRTGLIKLLQVLEFRSNNTEHQPVLDGLKLILRYADARTTFYPRGETGAPRKRPGGSSPGRWPASPRRRRRPRIGHPPTRA